MIGRDAADAADSTGVARLDLESIFEGRNVGLGRASPLSFADLQPGESVLELGSGAGRECLLAAQRVGERGRVVGVEVEAELVAHAREAARRAAAVNVEFRLGEADHLPAADASVDVVVSNCIVDLSPDQGAVFHEAFRVLRPGGRFAFSDVVARSPILPASPSELAQEASTARVVSPERLRELLEEAGFRGVRVLVDPATQALIHDRETRTMRYVASASVEAVRPAA